MITLFSYSLIPYFLLLGISRNPSISNSLIRWAFIGFSSSFFYNIFINRPFIFILDSTIIIFGSTSFSSYSLFPLNYISLHSSYYLGYCGMNYANIIGFTSFNIFIIQFLSGILLVSYSNNIFILCYDICITDLLWILSLNNLLNQYLVLVFIMLH